MSDVKEEFDAIWKAWNTNVSHSDIYHMILKWITNFRDCIQDQVSVECILKRMAEDDPTNEIVEDFIYGYIYAKLRYQFMTQQQLYDNAHLKRW